MASRRMKLISTAAIVVLGAAGYYVYSVVAQVAPPQLAQAPMNITNNPTPAFVMAVDDSGSMHFQTLFPGRDGAIAFGRDSTSGPGDVWSYFHSSGGDAGDYREAGTSGNRNVYTAPYPAPRQSAGSDRDAAIPPFDAFGFARSPEHNSSYFDPSTEYEPWYYQNGDKWPDAVPTAVRVNPNTATPTFDATNLHFGTTTGAATDNRFRLRRGMVMPAGTQYRTINNQDRCNLTASNNGFRTQDSDYTIPNSDEPCDVQIAYFPATFYLNEATPAPAGFKVANRTLIADACGYPGSGCNMYKYEIKPANYYAASDYSAAIRNFANWFSYYGARSRAIIAGTTASLVDVKNMRIGKFKINDYASYNEPLTKTAERLTMFDMTDTVSRTQLFGLITSMTVGGTTPNMYAVESIGKQFARTDSNAPIKQSCQRNAGMLFTDGFTNQDSVSGYGNVDGDMVVPFKDLHSNTMADIATYYYLNTNGSIGAGGAPRLRADLDRGQVNVPDACKLLNPDPKLNCQNNLHMNFYGITLGATGELYDPDSPADPFVTNPAWPTHVNNSANTVDDIWHATLNTRGRYINASTPAAITAAMRQILAAAGQGASPAGSIAVTGSRIGIGSLTVEPFYESTNNGTDWYGKLTAQTVAADPISGAATRTTVWEASSQMAGQGARNIKFGRTTNNVAPTVNTFSAANVSLGNLCANPSPMSRCTAARITSELGVDNTQAVAYLSGTRSLEGTILRTRSTILGDIVNSAPVVSSATDDYGYRTLADAGVSDYLDYAAYLATKRVAPRPMVYVGANDGMFHAFDGRATGATMGQEVFAYIPATALGHMGNLLYPYNPTDGNDQKFQHRYYVDGPVAVSDAHFGGSWKTVVVGTTGAGGRSVFAMDVTNPASIQVLWEVNNLITGNANISANIGHVLGKPVIVPVKVGGTVRWKAIFGNGYNSTNQAAVLFVVDIQTGAVTTISASEDDATLPAYNGLGNLVVLDRLRVADDGTAPAGRDGFADTVYAADQNGAVWKFDLVASVVGLDGDPLFIAEDDLGARQAITGGLEAAAGPGGGVMVYFGTGSFSFTGDTTDNSQQTVYAILDGGAAVSGRDQLLEQTIGTDVGVFRGTSGNAMTFGSRGWYLDLPAGERFVGNPRLESGIIFFPTYEPADGVSDSCATGGTNWLYGLNALSGAASLTSVRIGSPTGTSPESQTGAVALNTGGSAPVKDVAVMTTPRIAPLVAGATPAQIAAATAARCSMVVQVAGAPPMYLLRPCGRQSWRQVR